MAPKLTSEQREALRQKQGKPVDVEDDETRKLYVLVEKDEFCQMVDEELRRQLQIGFDQADAGDVVEWDVNEFRDRMHRRHDVQQS